ncbi:MAG: hypothetical protein R3C11_20385 [Planctomycetaceae bacterium]
MTYEVELKYALKDQQATKAALLELGAVEQAVEVQQDHYFNHLIVILHSRTRLTHSYQW